MNNCAQCGGHMEGAIEIHGKLVFVCEKPECPNYALLQIAKEKMSERDLTAAAL